MIKVLILSRDLDSQGGVVSVVSLLCSNFTDNIHADHFIIGQKIGQESIVLRIISTIIDAVRLWTQVKRKHYDVVHINPSMLPFSILRDGLFMVALRLVPFSQIVVFIHGWNYKTVSFIMGIPILRFLLVRIFRKARVVIVLASQFKNKLVEMSFFANRIYTFNTMFDGQLLKDIRYKDRERGKIILFLSRLIKEKGIYELLTAFQRIIQRFPKTNLVIAGDGPEYDSVHRFVTENELSSRVHLTGFIKGEEKAKVISEADIFVLPTYGEGCPVSLLEAMAGGLAVVTTSVGGIPDIVADGINGILLPDLDPETISGAIEQLLTDKNLFDKMCNNNMHKAWNNYEAKIVTRKMEKIYGEVVKQYEN